MPASSNLVPFVATANNVTGKDLKIRNHVRTDLPRRLPAHQGGGITTVDLDARRTHGSDVAAATFNANGEGTIVAVFDGGLILENHVEFRKKSNVSQSRVSLKQMDSHSNHATHVGGTVGAGGGDAITTPRQRPDAVGMAPRCLIHSYNWDDDLTNLNSLDSSVSISNHSYGPFGGWSFDQASQRWQWWVSSQVNQANHQLETEDRRFGKYRSEHVRLDQVLHGKEQLVCVVAAGNDRSDGPLNQPATHDVYNEFGQLIQGSSQTIRKLENHDQGGLDTIIGFGIAKNAICVGAMHDVVRDGQTIAGANIETTIFSNWGPTDDFRIKPDLIANGDTQIEPSIFPVGSNSSYTVMSGTSMASPSVAGMCAQLSGLYASKNSGNKPAASLVKALLIHTAEDDNIQAGPDPMHGWGSVNIFDACTMVNDPSSHIMIVDSVANDESKNFVFETPSNTPIRVTVVWADLPASANTGGLDDPQAALVNDLDVLVSGNGVNYYPYSLNRLNPLLLATTSGPNRVDNVEVVDTGAWQGQWTIKVNGTNVTGGAPQKFAIVVSATN